jgi:hypothetical protein
MSSELVEIQSAPVKPSTEPSSTASVEALLDICGPIEPPAKRRRGGQPVALDSRANDLLKALHGCLPMSKALALVELSDEQCRAWRAKYPKFNKRVEKVMADAEARLLRTVEAGGKGWQGCAWILERSRGYYQTQRAELTGTNGGPVQVQSINLHVLAGLGQAQEHRIKPLKGQ